MNDLNHLPVSMIVGADSGSSQSSPVESANTIQSVTTARVLFLTSGGQCQGLYDQVYPLKSVYFDNVPVMNSDGSLNFTNVTINERYGLPSQAVMDGFPSSSTTVNIGQHVTTGTPRAYTSATSTSADSMRVTIRLPALFKQDSSGNTNGDSVTFQLWTSIGSGAFTLYNTYTIFGKCTSATDIDYYVKRPASSTGYTWTVKVIRVSTDVSSTTESNDIYFQEVTEILLAQLPYNNYAYLGLEVSAQYTGSTFPTVSFDYVGRLISVPDNYNYSTRVYTGTWDGLFSSTKVPSDNPAWVLLDLLTDTTHGLGIPIGNIDIYSFYDAAVYNDALVPQATGGGTEPRFTFRYQFLKQQDSWTILNSIASAMNAACFTTGNTVRLVQDRPTPVSRVITNSNVVDGMFEYMGSQLAYRFTACRAYWNDPTQNFIAIPSYYEDTLTAAIARGDSASGVTLYGLSVKDIVDVGATSEGQALRAAKYQVETALANLDTVSFKVGFSNAAMLPGQVVEIQDYNYSGVLLEAMVASATSSQMTLDKPITITSGNHIDLTGSDGITIWRVTSTTTGTTNVINFNSPTVVYSAVASPTFAVATGSAVIITTTISPRYFKITNILESSPGLYQISGVQYDPNKFARVDGTPPGVTAVYQVQPSFDYISPVTGITFTEESYSDANNIPKTRLDVTWTPPVTPPVTSYTVYWNKDYGPKNIVTVDSPIMHIPIDATGNYYVTVYAVASTGAKSAPADAACVVDFTGGGVASLLIPVSNLWVAGTTSTTFTGTDCTVSWTDSNVNAGSVEGGIQVSVLDAGTSVVYRTELLPVGTTTYTYSLTKQKADLPTTGALKRSFIISVQVKDTFGRLTTATAKTFTTNPPIAPAGFVATGIPGSNQLQWTANTETDLVGYAVYRSTTPGAFSISAATKIAQGLHILVPDTTAATGTTYYYAVFAFDVFNTASDIANGTNVNISYSGATTSANFGIPKGTSFPSSASNGDVFFRTDLGHLYQYGFPTAATWNIVTTDLIANSVTAAIIAANAVTTSSLAAGAVTASKISVTTLSAINANLGSITTGQITMDASSYILGGQTAYNTGTGFFLGYSGGAYKFSLGNPAGNHLTWDGTNLNVVGGGTFSGALSAASGTFAGSLSAATGTFAGSLSAASGTFAGTLTAAAINAVDTINIAGQAISLPQGTKRTATCTATVTSGVNAAAQDIIPAWTFQADGNPAVLFVAADTMSMQNVTSGHTNLEGGCVRELQLYIDGVSPPGVGTFFFSGDGYTATHYNKVTHTTHGTRTQVITTAGFDTELAAQNPVYMYYLPNLTPGAHTVQLKCVIGNVLATALAETWVFTCNVQLFYIETKR